VKDYSDPANNEWIDLDEPEMMRQYGEIALLNEAEGFAGIWAPDPAFDVARMEMDAQMERLGREISDGYWEWASRQAKRLDGLTKGLGERLVAFDRDAYNNAQPETKVELK
jgi:hypothetical protein